ncbi:hypothetical protein AB0K60_37425 [Thermopolyspora sp. NPDC052614]|uniref:hypothetical protein n=1 Tax=Thermopolyspora sp. NPDC052614 TaxID=3155682 RepID=UPI0034329E18
MGGNVRAMSIAGMSRPALRSSGSTNYGPGWEEPLLRAYGVEPDPVRTHYYRLMWTLGP